MPLLTEPYKCKANAIIEYVTKTAVAGTGDEYCDPEWDVVTEYIHLSIEQTRNTREMEQPGSAADIIYMRGRLLHPKHWKGLCAVQQEYCMKFQSTPFVDSMAMVRVLPEVSSRMNLESVFGTHIQLEVRVDNQLMNSNEL